MPAKGDAALLKGLPKLKTQTTWVPWTYQHLSTRSGYGAGINWAGPEGLLVRASYARKLGTGPATSAFHSL